MKTRMRFFSLTLCLCLLCSLLFCSAVNVSAATDPTVTDGTGWTKLETLGNVMLLWGSDTNSSIGSVTSHSNVSLPFTGTTQFGGAVSYFYGEMDMSKGGDDIIVPPGEFIDLRVFTTFHYLYQYGTSVQQIPIGYYQIGCEISITVDGETIIVTPPVLDGQLYPNGVQGDSVIAYRWENKTDQPARFNRVTMGVLEGTGYVGGGALGFVYNVDSFIYRITGQTDIIDDGFKDLQDKIDNSTEQLKDTVEQQTEEHRNMFERLGDRISGFFSGLASSIGGFFTQLGDRIKGFFDDLLTGILDGIKKLFIPENDYFTEYFAQWDTWMSEHFGALYYPFDLLLDVLNRLLTLEVPERPIITFPAIEFRLPGNNTVKLSEEVEFDILHQFYADGSWTGVLGSLYEFYRVFVVCAFSFGLAALARKKLAEIMGGGSS